MKKGKKINKKQNTPKHQNCSHACTVDVSSVIRRQMQIRYATLPFYKEHLLPALCFVLFFFFFFKESYILWKWKQCIIVYYLRALYMQSLLKSLCHSSTSCKSGLLPSRFKIQHLYSSVSVSNLHINCNYALVEFFCVNSFMHGK